MTNYKTGDYIAVETREENFQGTLMPSDKKFLVLKLNNGYNIGIDNKKVKAVKLIKKYKKTTKKITTKPKKGLIKISILHTGGTIASKVDYSTGGVVASYKPEELIEMFPELNDLVTIHSRLVGNIMSEDMRFSHYNILAKEVEKEVNKGAQGVIITHGTDTMHYTSAALSFTLQKLPVPVILVGAQRSSDRPSSDAAINLISTAVFIANSNFSEVAICMHENTDDSNCLILPGLKTRKMHTSRRDAFRPINTIPFAKVDCKNKKVIFYKKDYHKKTDKKLAVKPFKENLKVGIIKIHPNMSVLEFKAYEGFDGLIIEGTGLGHAPIDEFDKHTKENSKIKKEIAKLAKKSVVAMASQTLYGRLQMNVYSGGRELQNLGVIGNFNDMTPETAFIKLAWLLSNFKKEDVKTLFEQNIAGEISSRTESCFLV